MSGRKIGSRFWFLFYFYGRYNMSSIKSAWGSGTSCLFSSHQQQPLAKCLSLPPLFSFTQGPLCRSSLLTTGEKWSLIPLRPYSRSRLGRFVLTVAARGPHRSLRALNPGLEQRDKCLIPSSESPVAQDSIHHARLLLRWGGPQQELGCWLRK